MVVYGHTVEIRGYLEPDKKKQFQKLSALGLTEHIDMHTGTTCTRGLVRPDNVEDAILWIEEQKLDGNVV